MTILPNNFVILWTTLVVIWHIPFKEGLEKVDMFSFGRYHEIHNGNSYISSCFLLFKTVSAIIPILEQDKLQVAWEELNYNSKSWLLLLSLI